jgi:hypothetical protein
MTTYYDVELLRQEQNPICWVASCAMVKGFAKSVCLGIGDLTGGFDPSNSCIANLASSYDDCTKTMEGWGFAVKSTGDVASGSVTDADLNNFLSNSGPVVLLHRCQGFPYGSQWGTLTFSADDKHAVVITGVDLDAQKATFNNPWGDKDQSIALSDLLAKINSDADLGKTLGVWSAATN